MRVLLLLGLGLLVAGCEASDEVGRYQMILNHKSGSTMAWRLDSKTGTISLCRYFHPFSGNVYKAKNIIGRGIVMCDGPNMAVEQEFLQEKIRQKKAYLAKP